MTWYLAGKYADPRDVQLEAVRRADGKPGWAHFLDMRLGKTAVALNEFLAARLNQNIQRLLVLSPNAYKADWVNEVAAAGIKIPVMALTADKRREFERFTRDNPGGICIVNYEALRSKAVVDILYHLCGPQTMIVADESIAMKNPSSITAKKSVELAKMCGIRRALTGKPTTQGPHDLWTQLRFIGAISGWNFVAFRNAFCQMGGFQGRVVQGIINEDRLHKLLDECSWRARKSDWLKTPGKDYMTLRLSMLPEQQKQYDYMNAQFLLDLGEGRVVSADQIITKLMKLQQIASGFIIDEEGKTHEIVPLEHNPKLIAVNRLLDEELATKLIIFYHFRFSGAALRLALARFNPAWIRSANAPGGDIGAHKFDLPIPKADIVAEKRKFTEDPTCRVMLAQIKASKFGHNLMGSAVDPCFTSLYYENTYSLDDRSQTEERNQGEGQQQPVTLIDFILGRRDEQVIEALRHKEDVAATILRYARKEGVLPPIDLRQTLDLREIAK